MIKMSKRVFKPKMIIPKDKLIDHLLEGLTLEEIGNKYGKAPSYISELCSYHGINIKDLDGRREAKKERKVYGRPFIDEFYAIIENEIKRGRQ